MRPVSAKQVVVGGIFLFQFLFPITRNPKLKRQWLDLYIYNLFQMVLSACSSYFEQLFVNFSEPNQIVILKDTSFLDISAIVDFMYRGEINVSQVKLDQCLAGHIYGVIFNFNENRLQNLQTNRECNNDLDS